MPCVYVTVLWEKSSKIKYEVILGENFNKYIQVICITPLKFMNVKLQRAMRRGEKRSTKSNISTCILQSKRDAEANLQ